MAQESKPLFLYEEIILLALRDEAGTFTGGYVEHAVAGAVLAELLLEGRLVVDDSSKKLVSLKDHSQTGDPIIDECLNKIGTASRAASLKTWVSRIANIADLRHRVAKQLCKRGVLKADEAKVLFIFTRRIYPELNPLPEKQLIERMRSAILSDADQVDPRTVVLISLAKGAEVLNQVLSREELSKSKKRVEQIVSGDLIGKATQDVIAACQTAVMVAAIMPAIIATTITS